MATKLGEGYYDVYPQVNQRAANAARDAIGAKLSKQFSEAQRSMEKDAEQSGARIVENDAKNAGERIASENRVSRTRSTNNRTATNESNKWSKLQHDISQKFQNDQSKNEGALHKLATQFRTIGTVARGLALGGAILSGFSLLENALGAISAAAPIAAAGIALIPAAMAGAVAEGIVLKGAFKGVGKALSDAFDPTKAKQFQQDLKGLAPAARSFVQEIAKAKGVLPNIQQTFFSQPALQQAAGRVRGFFKTISGSFKNLIAANGNLFGRLLGDVTNNAGAQHISSFLNNLARLLRTITPGIAALGAGFIAFIDHVSQSINGGGINKFLTNFGAWLAKINTKSLFAAATTAFKGFWYIATQLYGVISGIFKAFGGSDHLGDRFFKNIGGFFHEVNVFVNSKVGQTFLKQLIGTLNVLSSLANAVIKDALSFLAGAFAALYPAIKPFADEIKKVLKDLVPLGPVIGTILAGAFTALTNALKIAEPWIKKAVDYLVNHKEQVKEFADKLLLVVAAYLALKKAIGVAKPVIDLVGALKGLPAPLLAGLAAFALIAAAVIYTYNHSKLFRDLVASLKTNLDKLTKSVGLGKDAFKLWAGAVKGIVMGFLIADVILLNGVIIGLTKTIDALKRAFDNMKHWLLTGWNAVTAFFTKTFPGWFVTGIHAIEAAFGSVSAFFARWYNHVAQFFTAVVPHYFTVTFPGYFVSFAHIVEGIFNSVSAFFGRWYTHIAQFFTATIPHFFTVQIPAWFSSMRKSIMGVWNGLLADFSRWWTTAIKNVTSFGNRFGKVWSSIVHGVGVIWNGFSNVIETPVKFVVNSVYNNGIKRFWNDIAGPLHLPKLPNETFSDKPPPGAVAPVWHGLATGGHVPTSWGGPTQDNVPINVSGGEYVLKSESVKSIGLGYLNALNKYGNAVVGGDPSAVHVIHHGSSDKYASGGAVPAGAQAQVGPTLAWLKSIAGRVPYVLGANGPNAFDCSSLVGNVWARLTGNARNRRYFVTGTENNWLLSHGFARGAAPGGFNVGLTSPPEHTVGTLAGHRFEAAHTGTRMRFDDGAANALAFSKVYHMIGLSGGGGAFGLTGILAKIAAMKGQMNQYWRDPILGLAKKTPYTGGFNKSGLAGGLTGNVKTSSTAQPAIAGAAFLQTKLNAAAAAAAAQFGDAGSTNLTIANATQLEQWIAQASKYVNIPASWIPGILTIIRRESGGNPRAINRSDANARAGHPSEGLMQVIKGTFDANVPFSLKGRGMLDPVANIAAAVNYIHKRYGTIFNVQQANPHLPPRGYAMGGPVLVRDKGGPVYPGMNHIWNGTGAKEYINDPADLKGGDTHVYIDGHELALANVVKGNNRAVAASLNRRSK